MTDWSLIRNLVNTAIDTCENIEKMGVNENHRSIAIDGKASIHEFLISSWVAPENLTRKVICKSHELGNSKPYTDELSRTMLSIGALCSELVKLEGIDQKVSIDAAPNQSIKEEVEALCYWYNNFCVPSIQEAMESK